MKNITNSFTEWFKEKANSPIYAIFVVAVIAWNWRIFYVLFFESSSLLDMPRIEYAQEFSSVHEFLYTGNFFLDSLIPVINFILQLVYTFGIPVVLTYLAVWQLPKLNQVAHKKYLEFMFKRKLEFYKQNTAFRERVAGQKEKEAEAVKRSAVLEQEIEKQLTQDEKKWEKELEKVSLDQQNIEAIKAAIKVVYGSDGDYHTNFRPETAKIDKGYISPDFLSRIDTLSVVELIFVSDQGFSSKKIKFTEKGKFFVQKLQETHRL